MYSEPARVIAFITAFLTLLVDAVIVFGLTIDESQKVVLLSLITLMAPIVAGFAIRAKVFPPETVDYIANGSPEAEEKLGRIRNVRVTTYTRP